jgi:hypothetical protein
MLLIRRVPASRDGRIEGQYLGDHGLVTAMGFPARAKGAARHSSA